MNIKLNMIQRAVMISIFVNPAVKINPLQVAYEATNFRNSLFLTEDEKKAIGFKIEGDLQTFDVAIGKDMYKEFEVSTVLAPEIIKAIQTVYSDGFTAADAEIVYPIIEQLSPQESNEGLDK